MSLLEETGLDVDVFPNIANAPRAYKWMKGAVIAAGSFGKVYLGTDTSNSVLMAVRQVELPIDPGPNQEVKKSMFGALDREIEIHENVVQYLLFSPVSSIDEKYLDIFEYAPGGSAANLLQKYGAFEEPLVKNFVRQILQDLDYLHEHDIIHGDIRGANVLTDNNGRIKISDFRSCEEG
ncbi:hypothetical protein NLJ89_g10009 [Agrocybe chaxingu]|uniref:Protein kinase domain-containing protein n=1 Tax=Agrocybe chaxingu TaxID=84603 RepID=A0A9W8JRK5_9AGAR|nr:hypothetical protein NLJ89_g10009 [Agrocybe chaxingu]